MRKAKFCTIEQGETSLKQSEISEFKKKYRALIKTLKTENVDYLKSIRDNYGKYVMTTDISFKNEMVLCMSI